MKGKIISIPSEIFYGQHCETTATGNLLYSQGIKLSEPMMFGLGEGFGFIFLNLKSLNLPFIGGRTKPFELTETLCKNLNLKLEVKETISREKAYINIFKPLENGFPVGLQLDSYHLNYFSSKIHFAGHAVACIAIQDDSAVIVDTKQQGGVHKISLADLEKARFEKGPMSAKARSWTIASSSRKIELSKAIKIAVKNNSKTYLKPAFKGMGYLGIEKMAKSLPTWLKIAKKPDDLLLASLLMEKAGTGGSIFRCFYRDFLEECFQELGLKIFNQAHEEFKIIADDWETVGTLVEEAGTKQITKPLEKAAQICTSLASREMEAMRLLSKI